MYSGGPFLQMRRQLMRVAWMLRRCAMLASPYFSRFLDYEANHTISFTEAISASETHSLCLHVRVEATAACWSKPVLPHYTPRTGPLCLEPSPVGTLQSYIALIPTKT